MRAITIIPGIANSARLDEVADPPAEEGAILVRTLALGVCGTDREIVSGEYGEAPLGCERLVLGHESLGEVIDAPPSCGIAVGDRVVGIVRRPDPVPCAACAAGEWDMCRNGRYTERFRVEPKFAVKIDVSVGALGVLLEPTSIVAKAWDNIERIGRRSRSFEPQRLLITGAGPIGLLAALMGRQRGLEVHLLDRNRSGPKPALVADLGGHFHSGALADLADLKPDIVIECTGDPPVLAAALNRPSPDAILCLLGIGGPHEIKFDIGRFNRKAVLDNSVVFGSVNANRRHYQMAADALAHADPKWLGRLISRRMPLDRWPEALEHRPGDVKVVIDFTL